MFVVSFKLKPVLYNFSTACVSYIHVTLIYTLSNYATGYV